MGSNNLYNSFDRRGNKTRSKRLNLIGACDLCLARAPIVKPIATGMGVRLPDQYHTPPCSYILYSLVVFPRSYLTGGTSLHLHWFWQNTLLLPFVKQRPLLVIHQLEHNQLFISHSAIYLCSNVWEHYFPYCFLHVQYNHTVQHIGALHVSTLHTTIMY